MTNPAATIKVLITYAIIIPVAMIAGYVLTDAANSPTYSSLGFLGAIIALLFAPIFIKWHYPIMVFGLGCPAYVFFLKGSPPLWQVVTILSLGIAIVERTLNSDRRFIRVPSMTWPLLFTVAMAFGTAKLTGGIGLHTLSGEGGGGKKYIELFLGVAMYFALVSRPIPKAQRNLYIALFFLAGLLAVLGDLAALLPYPLDYINLVFPASAQVGDQAGNGTVQFGVTRLAMFGGFAGGLANFMLVKFGMRGIFSGGRHWWRAPFFLAMLALTLLGGFRITVIAYAGLCGQLFFLEGLHRTRLLMVFVLGGALGAALLVPLAHTLPYTFQRALSFLPLDVDPAARMDAEGSAEWRYRIWRDTWPQVPQYLLLGKGYALRAEDFEMIGYGQFANGLAANLDASQEGLAVSGDYHNGPLSTLMPFGIWGAISFIGVSLAALRVTYRNYKYGDPELKTVNTFLLAFNIQHLFGFFFVIGAFSGDIGGFAKMAGFSVALNWGVCGPARQPVTAVQPKPLPQAQPQPA